MSLSPAVIISHISLSLIIPNALNTTNRGTVVFILGNCMEMACPNPLFFVDRYTDNCLGDIFLDSGNDFISATQLHFGLFLDTLKHCTLFSTTLSCAMQVFSEPFIIKYPPESKLHSPRVWFDTCL